LWTAAAAEINVNRIAEVFSLDKSVGLATKVDVAGLFRALSLQKSQPIARNDGKWVVSLSELLVGGIELVVE
jgi:hypothetical protein